MSKYLHFILLYIDVHNKLATKQVLDNLRNVEKVYILKEKEEEKIVLDHFI